MCVCLDRGFSLSFFEEVSVAVVWCWKERAQAFIQVGLLVELRQSCSLPAMMSARGALYLNAAGPGAWSSSDFRNAGSEMHGKRKGDILKVLATQHKTR